MTPITSRAKNLRQHQLFFHYILLHKFLHDWFIFQYFSFVPGTLINRTMDQPWTWSWCSTVMPRRSYVGGCMQDSECTKHIFQNSRMSTAFGVIPKMRTILDLGFNLDYLIMSKHQSPPPFIGRPHNWIGKTKLWQNLIAVALHKRSYTLGIALSFKSLYKIV